LYKHLDNLKRQVRMSRSSTDLQEMDFFDLRSPAALPPWNLSRHEFSFYTPWYLQKRTRFY